jgi:hypothetical protein
MTENGSTKGHVSTRSLDAIFNAIDRGAGQEEVLELIHRAGLSVSFLREAVRAAMKRRGFL